MIQKLILVNICYIFLPGYIGPGIGGGVLAAIIGIICSFFFALFGILYYPIKRALNKRNKK
tara:strand:+ start:4128 stop:4310 length:183 start_codon:yes stop_codon:yes gene_type:complete